MISSNPLFWVFTHEHLLLEANTARININILQKVISSTCSFSSCVFFDGRPKENNNKSIKALEKYKRRVTIKTDFHPILKIHLLQRCSL